MAGSVRPAWFPSWPNECVAIIAGGPSAKMVDVNMLRGRIRVAAIKEGVELAPWADLIYGCDAAFWVNARGLPQYKGLKVSYADTQYPDIHRVAIPDPKSDKLVLEPIGSLGSGGNSGHQCINLCVQAGARGLLLIGFDMDDRGGVHWYGRANGMGRHNPGQANFRRWRAALTGIAGDLKRMDIDVVNTSPISTLTCFRRASVEDALRQWGL